VAGGKAVPVEQAADFPERVVIQPVAVDFPERVIRPVAVGSLVRVVIQPVAADFPERVGIPVRCSAVEVRVGQEVPLLPA
jgi:hypothetical protein